MGIVLRVPSEPAGASGALRVALEGQPPKELTLEPPPPELLGELDWLLDRWLLDDPLLPAWSRRAEQLRDALHTWACKLGQALEGAAGGPLRARDLELVLPASPEHPAHRWPWEWACSAAGAPIFAYARITRRIESPDTQIAPLTQTPPAQGPLRVLLLISRPAGPNAPRDVGYRNVARPLRELARGAGRALVVEVLPRPCTLEALQRRLTQGPPVHVLHIDAHGEPGVLALEHPSRHTRALSPQDLADALQDTPPPLVVLNACHSGQAAGAEGRAAQADFGLALHQRGHAAVLVMRNALRVDAAQRLTRAFYTRLLSTGDVAQATQAARQALAADKARWTHSGPLDLPDWGVPQLYLRRDAGLLPHKKGRRKTTTPDPGQVPMGGVPMGGVPMDWALLGLDTLVWNSTVPVAVVGTRGSGRTTLLEQARIWWTENGWGEVHPKDWAPHAGHPPSAGEALRSLDPAGGGPGVLIWDHVEALRPWEWSDDDHRALRGRLSALAARGVRVVMACTVPLGGWGARTFVLEGLNPREAQELAGLRLRDLPEFQRGGRWWEAVHAATGDDHHPGYLDGLYLAMANAGLTRPALTDAGTLPTELQRAYAALDTSLNALHLRREQREAARAWLAQPTVPPASQEVVEALCRAGAVVLRGAGRAPLVHPLLTLWLASQPEARHPAPGALPPAPPPPRPWPPSALNLSDLATLLGRLGRSPQGPLARLGLVSHGPNDATSWRVALESLGSLRDPAQGLAVLLEGLPASPALEAWRLRLRPQLEHLPCFGLRLHLCGSASMNTEPERLDRAHRFVQALVLEGLSRGASFTLQQSAEDHLDGRGDHLWGGTLLRALESCCQQGFTPAPLVVVTNPKHFPGRLLPATQALYRTLGRRPGLDRPPVDPGRSNGGLLRGQVAAQSDAAVLLGGGRGTLDLAAQMKGLGRPTLPLDLELGSLQEDADSAFRRFEVHPEDFLAHTGREALAAQHEWSLRDDEADVKAVAARVLDLLTAELHAARATPR